MGSAQQSAASTPLPQAHQVGHPPTLDIHSQLTLPPASTFDILPLLHELLSRLLASEDVTISPTLIASMPPVMARMYPNEQPLAVQQIGLEASKLRNRIRRARATVEALPDMDRDLQDQDLELDELRDRIVKQKAVLSGLTGAQ